MTRLSLPANLASVVCVGAHADDIEIGAGATIGAIAREHREAQFTFIVLTSDDRRRDEALASAESLLGKRVDVHVSDFEDGYLPYRDPARVKDHLKEILPPEADLVLGPHHHDAHQDHRFLAELLGELCRKQPILGYEIIKYDGDLGRPNIYIPISEEAARSKTAHIEMHFSSQKSKTWFDRETFMALMRLRGVEANAPEGYAEAFHSTKLVVSPTP